MGNWKCEMEMEMLFWGDRAKYQKDRGSAKNLDRERRVDLLLRARVADGASEC